MVDFSNVNSSVVLDVELSKDSDDTWFSVDNSETSESYLLSKTKNSKYSLDFSDKTETNSNYYCSIFKSNSKGKWGVT